MRKYGRGHVTSRRDKGTGGVSRRADGTWMGQVELEPGADGKRKRRYVYAPTKREAQQKVRALVDAAASGLPQPGKTTVAQYLDTWLTGKQNLRLSTRQRYRELRDVHIVPTLGKRLLAEVRPEHIEALYTQLLTRVSAGTVRNVHIVLHAALNQAYRRGLIMRNPCDLVEVPAASKVEPATLTVEQVRVLLAHVAGTRWESLYLLAVVLGLRQGELFGLRWQDIDLERGRLTVNQSIREVRGAGQVVSAPKTVRSRRTLVLPALLVESLRRHRGDVSGELVFPSAAGTPLSRGAFMRASWDPVRAQLGVPSLRFHDLRHSAASLMVALGVHPRVVSEILGHAQLGVTWDTYMHVSAELQADALTRLSGLLQQP